MRYMELKMKLPEYPKSEYLNQNIFFVWRKAAKARESNDILFDINQYLQPSFFKKAFLRTSEIESLFNPNN